MNFILAVNITVNEPVNVSSFVEKIPIGRHSLETDDDMEFSAT